MKQNNIHSQLLGIFNSIREHYQISGLSTLSLIRKWVNASHIKTWKDDFNILAKRYKR